MSISRMNARVLFLISLAVALCLSSAAQSAESAMDTAAIERLTGAKGAFDEKEGVFKVSSPRKDLSVTIAGVKMSPPMGLTSWAAFKRDGKDDVVMGDLVLLQDQVSPVMSAALDNGLEVTALHNHFIWTHPRSCLCTSAAWVLNRTWRPRSAVCSQRSRKPAGKPTYLTPKSTRPIRRWIRRSWTR